MTYVKEQVDLLMRKGLIWTDNGMIDKFFTAPSEGEIAEPDVKFENFSSVVADSFLVSREDFEEVPEDFLKRAFPKVGKAGVGSFFGLLDGIIIFYFKENEELKVFPGTHDEDETAKVIKGYEFEARTPLTRGMKTKFTKGFEGDEKPLF